MIEAHYNFITPSLWGDVAQVLTEHQHRPDLLAARSVLSAAAAHYLEGSPVWLTLMAPPGSSKTTLLEPLGTLGIAHLIDQVTPSTFLSGYVDANNTRAAGPKNSPSLLVRLGSSPFIVLADFSTILSLSPDKRSGVFSDLRRIFDGEFRKEFGTVSDPGDRQWKGRATILAACTPMSEKQITGESALGDRFLFVRWPRAGGPEAGLMAINQDKSGFKAALTKAMGALLTHLPRIEPTVGEEFKHKAVNLSEFVARARTPVKRDGYSKHIELVPEPEGNTRLAQQLVQLCKGSALLDRRSMVNSADFEVAVRVGLDSIPSIRRSVLDELLTGDTSKLPPSTRSYVVEELESLDIVVRSGFKQMSFSPSASQLLTEAGIPILPKALAS